MSHISLIGAAMYSDMAVSAGTNVLTEATGDTLAVTATAQGFFATIVANSGAKAVGAGVRFSNVRDFPQFGTPPNIVRVPVYGSATTRQVQGQADSPSIEITVNYIPADWESSTLLGSMVGKDELHVFRFTLLNSQPSGGYTSTTAGLGTTPNSQYYFLGKISSLIFQPSLSDVTTATVGISLSSQIYGAYTNNAV